MMVCLKRSAISRQIIVTTDYRDDRVYLGCKGKDAGYYAAQLLNEYDKDEFAARLAVFRTEN